jgi:hypothetical protein
MHDRFYWVRVPEGIRQGHRERRTAMGSVWRGVRHDDGCKVTKDGRPLPMQLELFNHSPTGFGWGYSGSGPAQLALAILCSMGLTNEEAVRLHQKFKALVVEGLAKPRWELHELHLRRVVEDLRDGRRLYAVVNREGKVVAEMGAPFDAFSIEGAEQEVADTYFDGDCDELKERGFKVVLLTPELEAQYGAAT